MSHSESLNLLDPEEMQDTIAPIIGESHVRPAWGSDFHTRLSLKPKGKVGLFTVRANSIQVHIKPPMPFFGVNVPLGRPLSISQASRPHEFLDDINLTRPDRPIDIKAAVDCRVLAVILYREMMQEHAARLTRSARPLESRMQTGLSMKTPDGHALGRSLARLWSAPLPDSQTPGAQIRLAELEDDVITNFILAATETGDYADQSSPNIAPHCLRLAEDYLCARLDRPVSRAELAAASGASIRTLSRAFMRRHGLGPMQFLKARRLDATYRDLLGTSPEYTSVTEVALRYGFNHLGKFASDYRQTFGESPSATLRGRSYSDCAGIN